MRGEAAAGVLCAVLVALVPHRAFAQGKPATPAATVTCVGDSAPVEQKAARRPGAPAGNAPTTTLSLCGVAILLPPGATAWACQRADGTVDGAVGAWYASGRPYLAGECADAAAHGRWKRWYETGKLALEFAYHRGTQHGTWTLWSLDGKRISEANLERGKLHGKQTSWHRNGAKAEESWYRRGKRVRAAVRWDERGKRLPDPPRFPAPRPAPRSTRTYRPAGRPSRPSPSARAAPARRPAPTPDRDVYSGTTSRCRSRIQRALAIRQSAADDPTDLDLGNYLQSARLFLIRWCNRDQLTPEVLQCFMRSKRVVELAECALSHLPAEDRESRAP